MKSGNDFSPGRRRLLIAGGTLGLGILGAASWGVLENYRAMWVERVVRENLPGIELDPDSLQTFITAMLGHERLQRKVVKATVFANRFVPWLPASVGKARDGLDGLERFVLTEYLIGSNFFHVPDPKRATIVYTGITNPCGNPFRYSSSAAVSQAGASAGSGA
jgi:hypothetical protein